MLSSLVPPPRNPCVRPVAAQMAYTHASCGGNVRQGDLSLQTFFGLLPLLNPTYLDPVEVEEFWPCVEELEEEHLPTHVP